MTALPIPPPKKTPGRASGTMFLVLAPIAAAVIIAVGYAVVLRGQVWSLRDLVARQSVERVSVEAQAQVDRVAIVEQEFAKVPTEDREKIDRMVPGGEDVPGLFVAFDAAAQRAGVAITSMDVVRESMKDLTASGGARMLAASISVRNVDYTKLKAFLNVLASSERLLDVLTVQFSPQARNASVLVRAYTID